MKNCGRRFHNEVGKFRFLNELIKVVSPKVSNIESPLVGTGSIERLFDVILRWLFAVFAVLWRQNIREGEDESDRDGVQLDLVSAG